MKKLLLTLVFMVVASSVVAKDKYKGTYTVAWSHYTGWEPWGYAKSSGILKKWADKYGIKIELKLVNDYVESMNLYNGGKFQAVVMTNMDALTSPAIGGIDTTALIVGDFSNGNDGIVIRNGKSVKDLKGKKISLVELSVSHYLLARALDMNGMAEKDVKLVNTSDADIPSLFITKQTDHVVTWNPGLLKVRNSKGANMVFDSSKIKGEIIDIMFVRTDSSEKFKKALTGAWYETMAVMSKKNKKGKDAIAAMAKQAGNTVAEFNAQLKTTSMFYKAADAATFTAGKSLIETMQKVRTFSFEKGLFNKAKSKDVVGILFPNGTVLGNKKNIKLRFTDKYMKAAAEGKL